MCVCVCVCDIRISEEYDKCNIYVHELYIYLYIYILFLSKQFVDNIFKCARPHLLATQLNVFNYCYPTLISIFDINQLFSLRLIVSNIAI